MRDRIHWDEIRKLAIAHQLEDPGTSAAALVRFLRFWWCRTYNRPFKDPLLESYTTDELCYEYLRYYYAHPDNDPKKKIEAEQNAADDEEWIKKMLATAPKPAEPEAPKPEIPKEAPKLDLGQNLQSFPDLPEFSAKFEDLGDDPVK